MHPSRGDVVRHEDAGNAGFSRADCFPASEDDLNNANDSSGPKWAQSIRIDLRTTTTGWKNKPGSPVGLTVFAWFSASTASVLYRMDRYLHNDQTLERMIRKRTLLCVPWSPDPHGKRWIQLDGLAALAVTRRDILYRCTSRIT
ncbi:hypothetical protein MVEN_01521900 [Mycena venus]|uniref:Uncharacterized protein n=1 Tax=Mycena venus TaxID=2733690 RepID=A0A8H7CRJ6_9AGAR|nr:hypothetical protein MVEN_01521900 [Mycena venus]